MSQRAAAKGATARNTLLAVLAAGAAPFIITGVFRFISDSPVVAALVVVALAAGLLAWRPHGRFAAAGLLVGGLLWTLVLAWLFTQFGGISEL